ncbi:hypothetical protein P3T76_006541 [Phytophthora citrophthora]|uniref:Uncharacterized protein n=1 Tax=Phytophthora citrophthora TaxID=4793 RepID=A0AAD9LPK5_9STRA|nr:hypothetical protein P3T76_006541 [Phytophthora citrophthora]
MLMGNATSGETELTQLKSELVGMNRSLEALSVRCRPPPVLRPDQILVDNVIITTREDVSVVLGPVVGKVDFQRARVLLEVNRAAIVTARVSTLDAVTNSLVEVPQYRVSVHCEADSPSVFILDRLVPGKRYSITFEGIRQEDATTKRASFQTQTLERGNQLNVVAVSGDNVFNIESGEMSLWTKVRERVERQEIQIILHLGGQVAMQQMFDKAVQLLLLHCEGLSYTQADWPAMEKKAMDILRSAYRTQWTLAPHLQFVLANASNLMMWNDADIYPRFTTRDKFYIDHEQPTLQMQVLRTVTRCARRLYHEYQRQLWDDDFKQVVVRETELMTIAEKALASTAQIFVLSSQIPKTAEDLELQKKRHDIEGARRLEKSLRALEAEKMKLEKELVSYNQVLAPQRGEEFLFEVGSIGIFLLDLRSNRLEPGGSQMSENELLSNVQWRFIEETLERTDLRLLLVCSESPVIDDVITEVTDVISETWSADGPAQARFLSQLFEWKLQQPNREFVVISGGNPIRCFGRMRVKDAKLRTEAEQVTVGAISAYSSQSETSKRSGTLHDRFEFQHEELVSEKCFVELKLESGQSNKIEVTRVGKDQYRGELPKVLLGPVVGWVDDWCAVILLEVDRDADVVCVVKNPLTHESRRVFQRFFADQANSFFLTHLRSGHYYLVTFQNIQHPEQFQASFTTTTASPQQFNVLAVCNERKTISILQGDGERSLWHTIAENTVEIPFVGLNFTLHLGGQFFPEVDSHIHEALVYADSTHGDPTSLIHGRIREMYRATWNTPGVRESLANGAHVILTNKNDQLPLNNQDGEDQQSVSIREQLSKIHVRYQNLLLPPSKRLKDDEMWWQKPLSHSFGAFGLFILPINQFGSSCIHESTWEALRVLLATPRLSTLLLVSTEPLVEESLEEIEEKASMDTAYRRTFGFYRQDVACLLEMLFDWRRTSDQNKRKVVFLSGSRYQSFSSVVREVYSSESSLTSAIFPNFPTPDAPTIVQYTVGPLQVSDSIRPSILLTEGTLLGRYTYRHSCIRTVQQRVEGEESTPKPATNQITSQFVHLLLETSDKLDIEPAEIPTPSRMCNFVSNDPLEADRDPNSGSNGPEDDTIRCYRTGNWQLPTVMPSWLREILTPSTTEVEEEQVKERMAYLRTQDIEIQTAFEQNPDLLNGLVTFSMDKKCTAVLAESFGVAHKAGGSDFRKMFPDAPSRFIVAFTIQQLRVLDPPVQQLPTVGVVELQEYALLFQHSFINTWLLNQRLQQIWN